MRLCFAVEINTPKKVLLDGLWFGPKNAPTVIILIHGLGGSLWRRLGLVESLADKHTAVLAFNNRGHDRISRLVRVGEKKNGSAWAGGASEVFEDCVDDIQGAVDLARRHGAKRIFLAGHSTGSQKSIYYASRKGKAKFLKGIVLMVPLSDYSVALRDDKNRQLARAIKLARALIKRGKPHELLPQSIWPPIDDAQRLLSLYTPDSTEEMFTYAQSKKLPKLFRSVQLPILAIFAGADEFADRPAEKIALWFEKHSRSKKFETFIVPNVGHGFKGGEAMVVDAVRKFIYTS